MAAEIKNLMDMKKNAVLVSTVLFSTSIHTYFFIYDFSFEQIALFAEYEYECVLFTSHPADEKFSNDELHPTANVYRPTDYLVLVLVLVGVNSCTRVRRVKASFIPTTSTYAYVICTYEYVPVS